MRNKLEIRIRGTEYVTRLPDGAWWPVGNVAELSLSEALDAAFEAIAYFINFSPASVAQRIRWCEQYGWGPQAVREYNVRAAEKPAFLHHVKPTNEGITAFGWRIPNAQ